MSTVELTSTARTYREIQAEIKQLEEQADALKQRMIKELDTRNTEKLEAGEYTIHWGLYETTRLDSKALKAEHADLYARYSKKTVSTRFQVA
jgi:predicted phage-related endonuclease